MKETERETLDLDLGPAMDLMARSAVALSEKVVADSAPGTIEEFGTEVGRLFTSLLTDIVQNKQITSEHMIGIGSLALIVLSIKDEEDGGEA